MEPFVVVQQYVPLSPDDAKSDPFRAFPALDTWLYYDMFKPLNLVIRLSDIVAHCATLEYMPEGVKNPCIVVRSLDRVRGSSTSIPFH